MKENLRTKPPLRKMTSVRRASISLNKVRRDRDRLKAALRESEAKFQSIAEGTVASIFILQGTRFRYVNRTMTKMTGFSREELLAINFWDIVHPDHRELVKRRGLARLRGGSPPPRYEYKIVTKSGEVRWVEGIARIIRFEGTRAESGSVFDITDRKRSELERERERQSLRESEERYRSIFTFAPDALYVHVDGRITLVNPAMCQLLGANDPSQLIGNSVFEIVHPDYHETIRKRWKVIAHGQPAPLLEEQFIRLDGAVIDVEVGAVAIDWHGSKGVQVIARDVTERKKAEQALRESEERYRALFVSTTDGLLVDVNGKVIIVNPAFCRLLGADGPSQIEGRSMFEIVQQGYHEKVCEGMDLILRGWPAPLLEEKLVRFDGNTIDVEVNAAPVDWQGTKGIQVVVRDISERKKAEIALRASMDQLHLLAQRLERIREEERTRLAQEIHDDFGAVLTAMKMHLTVLSEKIRTDETPHSQSFLVDFDYTTSLVDMAFKSLRTITGGLRPWVLETSDLPLALDWLAREFQKHSGIACAVEVEFKNVLLGRERTTAVFRIVQEALTNIARHSGAKKVAIGLKKDKDMLVVQVKDDGRGISETEMASHGSLGILGMKERALALGGEVRIQRMKNKGTIVRLEVPLTL